MPSLNSRRNEAMQEDGTHRRDTFQRLSLRLHSKSARYEERNEVRFETRNDVRNAVRIGVGNAASRRCVVTRANYLNTEWTLWQSSKTPRILSAQWVAGRPF